MHDMKSFEETADLLAKLYNSEFNGKKKGRFRIARSSLAITSDRKNIEQLSLDQIRIWLSEKHGLFFIDLHDEFVLIDSRIFRRYRKATDRILKDVLGITFESDEIDDDE